MTGRSIAITGASGYIGRALTTELIERGHTVRALVRSGSQHRLAAGASAQVVDVFEPASLAAAMRPGDTVVHLIGTPHPNPRKAQEFQRVDLGSAKACIAAARQAAVEHFVYVSVAQPAPVMHAYVAARAAAELALRESRLTATVLRPWYVLGPGHRWPYLLLPVYACAALIPATRDGARRLGLVTLSQMVRALRRAVESPAQTSTVRIFEVPEIRK